MRKLEMLISLINMGGGTGRDGGDRPLANFSAYGRCMERIDFKWSSFLPQIVAPWRRPLLIKDVFQCSGGLGSVAIPLRTQSSTIRSVQSASWTTEHRVQADLCPFCPAPSPIIHTTHTVYISRATAVVHLSPHD